MPLLLRRLRCRHVQQAQAVGEVQRHPPVAVAERLHAHPHHLARAAEEVEVGRTVRRHARRQQVALEHGRGERGALELLDHVEERVGTAAHERRGPGHRHVVPLRQEAREGRGRRRLDLLAQPRQRTAAERRQHVGIAPLAAVPARTELALQHASLLGQALQRGRDGRLAHAEAARGLGGRERSVRPRVACDELGERVGHRCQERLRQARRRHDAERVAVARRVLGGDETRRRPRP